MNIKLKRVGYGLFALILASNFVFFAPKTYASDGLFAKVASKGKELKSTLADLKLDVDNEIATVKGKIASNNVEINVTLNDNQVFSGNSASASASASALNNNTVSPSGAVTIAVNTSDGATAKAETSTGSSSAVATTSNVAKTTTTSVSTGAQNSNTITAPNTGRIATEAASAEVSLIGAIAASMLITIIGTVLIRRR